MITESALPLGSILPQADRDDTTEETQETTPGSHREVRWEVVALANGLAEAAIIQGRLEAEGVPARVHQEPAGVAIGLTIGKLGQAKVMVPEPLVQRALDILGQPIETLEEDDED